MVRRRFMGVRARRVLCADARAGALAGAECRSGIVRDGALPSLCSLLLGTTSTDNESMGIVLTGLTCLWLLTLESGTGATPLRTRCV